MSLHHDLKCDWAFFEAVRDGRKTFEIRFNDRGFQAGDKITLKQKFQDGIGLTGRTINATITYVIGYQQQAGWVVFSFRIDEENHAE